MRTARLSFGAIVFLASVQGGLGSQRVADEEDCAKGSAKKLVITFAGGNAYVFTEGGRRVQVGPVSVDHSAPPHHFNPHPMFLKVVCGEVKPHPLYSSRPLKGHPGFPGISWELRGYEVWPCPDGDCPRDYSLTASPDKVSEKLVCGNHEIDDLAYVPDLMALHPSGRLKSGWEKLLDGRIVLAVGRLRSAKANNCFTFKRGPIETKQQGIADGIDGVQYQTDVREFVDLVFKKPGSRSIAGVRIHSKNGRLALKVGMLVEENDSPPMAPTEVQHFQQFYRLLDRVPPEERFKLIDLPSEAKVRTPGSGCPPARFGGGS